MNTAQWIAHLTGKTGDFQDFGEIAKLCSFAWIMRHREGKYAAFDLRGIGTDWLDTPEQALAALFLRVYLRRGLRRRLRDHSKTVG